MQQGFLKFAAVVLGTGLVVVPFLGLDGLSRDLRRQIASERSALSQAQQQVGAAEQRVTQDLQAEPDLFRGIPASRQWQADLAEDAAAVAHAAETMAQLTALEKQDRRQDRARAAALVAEERTALGDAGSRAVAVEQQAGHWVELKRQMPATLARMDRDYQMIHSFDAGAVTAAAQKAEAAWPEKRGDLESRLNSDILQRDKDDEALWQSTANARREAAAGHFAAIDTGALLMAADKLHADSALLPRSRANLEALVGQLNTTWDKVLVDMDKSGRTYREDLRTVATPQGGQTTSEEAWVPVSQAQYDSVKNDLGMAIEHKPAGKYDSEAERVAQPPGFAYMAPPGERNQYGYWDHHDGQDFWVFYGQYALMRDLLFNHSYQPIPRYDWDQYRTYNSRGQTYYGRDAANSAPRYGTQGTATQDRYAGSNYARNGGFRNSPYASKSGGFRDSQFATPGNSTPKRFGGGSHSEPGFHTPAPRPRPSFRMPSTGRRFGRR